jgi:hypothetical protein
MYSPRRVVPEKPPTALIAPESSAQKLLRPFLPRCRSLLWLGFFISALFYPSAIWDSRMTTCVGAVPVSSPHFTPDEGSPASEAQEPDGS